MRRTALVLLLGIGIGVSLGFASNDDKVTYSNAVWGWPDKEVVISPYYHILRGEVCENCGNKNDAKCLILGTIQRECKEANGDTGPEYALGVTVLGNESRPKWTDFNGVKVPAPDWVIDDDPIAIETSFPADKPPKDWSLEKWLNDQRSTRKD